VPSVINFWRCVSSCFFEGAWRVARVAEVAAWTGFGLGGGAFGVRPRVCEFFDGSVIIIVHYHPPKRVASEFKTLPKEDNFPWR